MNRKVIFVGIDEAGRGPLAGPIVFAAVSVLGSPTSNWKSDFLKGIRDSKKLTPKTRDMWYHIITKKAAHASVAVSHVQIDRLGLSIVGKRAIAQLLKKLTINYTLKTKNHLVLLDGGLAAPNKYRQKTIIKGDEKVPLIAAASIIAKVTRDRMMIRMHKKYPRYGFAIHKGYGTKAHIAAIKRYGFSRIHRKSFCTRIV